MKILFTGAERASDIPGLGNRLLEAEFTFAPDLDTLARELPDTEVVVGWDFRGNELESQWHLTKQLQWIHWCGAGVDAALFDGLVQSDVMLTNARGVFDRPMAEYTLGYMLMEVKRFRETIDAQSRRKWNYQTTHNLAGQSAAIYGVGSIGRQIAKTLTAVGVNVVGVGRTARESDPDFGKIYGSEDAHQIAGKVDWVIGILPSTPQTENYFNADFFNAMKPSARFINLGRGKAQDEDALLYALKEGQIAGAMIDVFKQEPLPEASPLWSAPNLMISPHMSGDYYNYHATMVDQFFDNLQRYKTGEPLRNIVNKSLGFVAN